jgi:hypothetical protein
MECWARHGYGSARFLIYLSPRGVEMSSALVGVFGLSGASPYQDLMPYAPSHFPRQLLSQSSHRTTRDEIVNPTAEPGDLFYDS